MSTDEIAALSLTEAAAMIAARKLSSVEATEAVMHRIARRGMRLNCIAAVEPFEALANARAADEALAKDGPAGPLHGVPLGHKDMYYRAGRISGCGSKIREDYVIPDQFRNNTPERLADDLRPFKEQGLFSPFPFGTDFTDEELKIGKALKTLKATMSEGLAKVTNLGKAATIFKVPDEAAPYLERMDLTAPSTAKEKMMQKLVIHALNLSGVIGG